jgi:cellulose synthase/poly-beta-1,6-N-acetylglucosamine synthase-like glycosyltransferase
VILLDCFTVTYTIFLLFLIAVAVRRYLHRSETSVDHVQKPISIVIPFRNEEANLSQLLASLDNLDYGSEIEIVLIDDNSTDKSVQVVRETMNSTDHTVTLCSLKIDTDNNLTSKQQAIDLGVRKARFDTIVFTDADMQFKPGWLASLDRKLTADVALVFGRTSILLSNKGLFQFFQAFQLDFLFATAYTFFHAGIPGSCMGNNMAISRQKYLACGGFEKIGYSLTEDRALYAHFKKNGLKIDITEPFTADALTYPCENSKQFFNQMKRWAMGGLSNRSVLFPITLLFAIQNIVFCVALTGVLPKPATIIVVVNFLLTWLYTIIGFKGIKAQSSPGYFPLFFALLIIEVVSFTISFIVNPSVSWKGRSLTK